MRLQIADAGPKGSGVFAAAPIRARTTVMSFLGPPKWIWDIPRGLWPHAFQVDYDRYVVPRRNGAGWAINHSCEPNCLISGTSVISRKRIEKGEELTFDYSTDVDWPDYKMPCRCGSRRCRKVVRAYRHLPKRLKSKYGRNVADYIWKRYGERRGSKRRIN